MKTASDQLLTIESKNSHTQSYRRDIQNFLETDEAFDNCDFDIDQNAADIYINTAYNEIDEENDVTEDFDNCNPEENQDCDADIQTCHEVKRKLFLILDIWEPP